MLQLCTRVILGGDRHQRAAVQETIDLLLQRIEHLYTFIQVMLFQIKALSCVKIVICGVKVTHSSTSLNRFANAMILERFQYLTASGRTE